MSQNTSSRRPMLFRLSVIVAVLVASMAALGITSQVAEASIYNGTVVIDCTNWDAAGTGSHILNRDNTGLGQEQIRLLATDGAGNTILDFTYSNTLTTFTGGIGTGAWTSAPLYNPITFKVISTAGNGLPEQLDFTATGACAGLPTFSPPAPVPGPDLVGIPSQAVVGSFVATTAIYGTPNSNAATSIVMEAGKTAWVYGVDASGQFYKVVLSGQYFWVPVNTMGPNYDKVWNGTPLPTTVVS